MECAVQHGTIQPSGVCVGCSTSQSILHYFELQLADCCEDRGTVAVISPVSQHLHCTFFQQLSQALSVDSGATESAQRQEIKAQYSAVVL